MVNLCNAGGKFDEDGFVSGRWLVGGAVGDSAFKSCGEQRRRAREEQGQQDDAEHNVGTAVLGCPSSEAREVAGAAGGSSTRGQPGAAVPTLFTGFPQFDFGILSAPQNLFPFL